MSEAFPEPEQQPEIVSIPEIDLSNLVSRINNPNRGLESRGDDYDYGVRRLNGHGSEASLGVRSPDSYASLRFGRYDLVSPGMGNIARLIEAEQAQQGTDYREVPPPIPLPERLENESVTTYLRRAFELTPEEKDSLYADCDAFIAKTTRKYSHRPHARISAKNDTDFIKWKLTGEPGELLPQAITTNGIPTVQLSFPAEMTKLENTHGERVHKIVRNNKDTINALIDEEVKASSQYTFLASFMKHPETALLQDVPLSEAQKLIRVTAHKAKLAREGGFRAEAIESPYDAATFAAKKELQRYKNRLEQETISQRLHDPQAKDPFLRLREWAMPRLKAAWQDRYPGSELGSNPYSNPSELIPVVAAQLSSTFNDMPRLNEMLENMIKRSLLAPEGPSYEQSLANEAESVCSQASNMLARPNSNTWGVLEAIWLRKPQYVENHPVRFEGDHSQNMVDSESMEALRSVVVARITHDERSPEQKEQMRLILWGDAADLPEVSDVASQLTLHFEARDVNGAAQNYVPEDVQPAIPGYLVVAARETVDGKSFDFIQAEQDPYRPCHIPFERYVHEAESYFQHVVYGGIPVLEQAMREHTGELTVDQFVHLVKDRSEVYIPDSKSLDDIVVKNGTAYMQCVGAGRLLSGAINWAFGKHTAHTLGGYVMVPGEDTITLLGHAQVELTKDGQQYIVDATPDERVSSEPNDAATYDNLLESTLLGEKDISYLLNVLANPSVPEPRVEKPLTPTQKSIIERQNTYLKPEAPDLSIIARQIADAYPQKVQTIRQELEDIVRVRLGIESSKQYANRDKFYSYVMKIAPYEGHPLRVALKSVLVAHRAAEGDNLLSAESSTYTQATLEKIARFQAMDPAIRKKKSKATDDTTLVALKSKISLLAAEQERAAWAQEILEPKTDDVAQ